MLVQSESEPMTIPIRLVFEGSVCLQSLQTAVADAASSHPLLTSCVKSSNDSLSIYEASPTELRWVPSKVTPVINELSLDESGRPSGLRPQSDRIDLACENGFKTFVSEQNGNTDVHFLFHHAACDGLGGFKFVTEVLARYHSVRTGTQPPIAAVDSEILNLRNAKCEPTLPWHRRVLRSCFVLPRRISGMIGQTPARIEARTPAPETVADQPASSSFEMPTITLSKPQTVAVSQYASVSKSTTNELLIHQLFKVVFAWNRNAVADDRGKLRIIVPFSLRKDAHSAMPAANCVSMVYVDAGNSADGIDPLGEISKQIEYIRKWQIQYSWNQTASFAFRSKRLESLLRTQSGRHLCTTVLSNLGQPFKNSELPLQKDGRLQVGDLILNSAHLAAPPTSNTIATFGVLFYADRLTLTMNFNKTKMSRGDAETLMELWGKSLTSLD